MNTAELDSLYAKFTYDRTSEAVFISSVISGSAQPSYGKRDKTSTDIPLKLASQASKTGTIVVELVMGSDKPNFVAGG